MLPESSARPRFMADLAEATGSTLHGDTLLLPAGRGKSSMQVFDLGPQLKLLLHHTELAEELLLQKPGVASEDRTIIFSFRNPLPLPGPAAGGPGAQPLRAVQVTSGALDFALRLPAHTPLSGIVIAADASLLESLLDPEEPAEILQSIVSGQYQALYEELITPAMQAVAADILAATAPAPLRRYYYQLKAKELIYLFLAELLKRQRPTTYPLSAADARQLYVVRDALLADLSEPPSLPALARLAGLSESKLKRLFKQVFGDTMYNYFQTVRMREAAHLLETQRLSVTEVGYQLGFKNLSHFSRLFARYIGTKPKRYSQPGGAAPARP